MDRKHFEALLRVTGPIAPEGLEQYIGNLTCSDKELLRAETLLSVLEDNQVTGEARDKLLEALKAVNACPELVELGSVMAIDTVRALHRCTACEFTQPKPDCLEGFAREAFAFLFTQRCVLEGRKALRARGIPESYDHDIPERMTRKQLRKYRDTGDISFDDYPWDINFYGCGIFLLDRFYFIPYRWEDTPEAWRNKATGKVTALWKGGARVRRDGQLDGVNGITDSGAFTTVYEESGTKITAHPVSPEGHIRAKKIMLKKKEWEKVLGEGDYVIALHIPGGPGYTPDRVRTSCLTALDFFGKYYPEYHYAGFWSESWLFDPAIGAILGPNRNISRVQRQFYCYPTPEGDDMARRELLHDPKADFRKFKAKTTLERGMFNAWNRGERFHTTGMFLLREEVSAVGRDPYWQAVRT